MRLFLDIETLPDLRPGARDRFQHFVRPPGNYKKPEAVEKWEAEEKPALVEEKWRDTALNGAWGHAFMAGWAIEDSPPIVRSFVAAGEELAAREREFLRLLFADITDALHAFGGRCTIVGHNVGWDVRFLWHRAVILRVPLPPWWPDMRLRNQPFVEDTMDLWCGVYDRQNRIKLDDLAAALGAGRKTEGIDGSKVYDMVMAGEYRALTEYCANDVALAREVYRRLTPFWQPLEADRRSTF